MGDPLTLEIERLLTDAPERVSPLGAGILVAVWMGIANDSRSFSRKLEVAHALVLRECVALAEEAELITLEDREDKSQRLFYILNDQGFDLFKAKDLAS